MEKIIHTPTNSKLKKDLLVLNYLQKNGPKSRVDLSTQLNLTKAAITAITNDMIKTGVLLEKGEQVKQKATHSRGRRKILLDINENYKLVFGVVIEKENMFFGLTNLKGQVLDKRKMCFKGKNYHELLELIVLNIGTIMKNNCITNENVLALGVCLSNNCGELIEGVKSKDKIMRLRKDLAHAMPIKIITNTTIASSLVAQRIFAGENSNSVLLLRYGDEAESGIMIDGKIYSGFTGNAGGFLGILGDNIGENEQLASAIITCNTVLDTQKIYCFGNQFEDEANFVNIQEIIVKYGYKKLLLQHAIVTNDTAFLAPCAEAIDCYFYVNHLIKY
ncbi:MAG: winged helix-turn-helix transcriptional regulator [Oscillospiraceae bacterium]